MPREKPQKGHSVKPFLELDSMGDLSRGMARAAINKAINDAVADTLDRGREDGKARTVSIDLSLLWTNGAVLAQVDVKAKLPPMRTPPTICEEETMASGALGICYRRSNPENPEQPTFDDVGAEE